MAHSFFTNLHNDIAAVMTRDPAARNRLEVITCYAGYKAVRSHRRAHWLWKHDFKWFARMTSHHCARKTGIEIHPGAVIGDGFFIDHGNGVVIGETTVIGDNVTLYQGVTLGGTGKDIGKRHPTIGNRVVIGAGAKVLGPFSIGDDARVGAGAIVLKEVPPNCTVVGNPGRIVKRGTQKITAQDLDQIHLPDPMKESIDLITERLHQLESCICRLSEHQECSTCENSDTKDCFKKEGELPHADL